MKKIAFACLLAAANMAHASDWALVAQSDNIEAFLDKSSIARHGKLRKAWVSYTYKELQKADGSNYLSSKSLQLFSCTERTSGTYQATSYTEQYGNGAVVKNWLIAAKDTTFSEVVPDSLGESIINAVCSKTLPAS